ncbi:MAG: tetratricopeptide repeat protein [Gemmatales bacterium]
MPVDQNRVQQLFLAALELSDAEQRIALLNRECDHDAALRHRLDSLLDAHEQIESGTETPPILAAWEQTLPGERVRKNRAIPRSLIGSVIGGRYTLQAVIGEGGMGTVYRASQSEPVQRQVALKLLRPGLDTQADLARFEVERQALALMDHPNIARVLDGGLTDGRPYFVMDLVEGLPITRYCDEHVLSVDERLALLIAVCHAVQHAHQKGIIHRDLKPSNVLIAKIDGRAVPRVIDFGIAKAAGQRLTANSQTTAVGLILGTPEYMSPEQAAHQADVDTRTDIYSLGVLLYELIAGTVPFDRQQAADKNVFDLLRAIRENEPPTPGAWLKSSASQDKISAARGLSPSRLIKLLNSDLAWIAMKSLEKDRDHRYDTAVALAEDIERYRRDEPVSAGRPTVAYRFRKLLRRYRGRVIAACLLLLSMIAGIVGTTVGLFQARAAETTAREAAITAREAEKMAQRDREEAVRQKQAAVKEHAITQAVNTFLLDDVLGQADALGQATRRFEPTPQLTLRETLDRAAEKVQARFADQPAVEAAVRQSIGDSYKGLGIYDKAIVQLKRAAELSERHLGPNDPQTTAALHSLAVVHRSMGHGTEAIRLFEQARDRRIVSLGEDHEETLNTLNSLAVAYYAAGRMEDALRMMQKVYDISLVKKGPNDSLTMSALNNLAAVSFRTGRSNEGVQLLKKVYELRAVQLGADHPSTLTSAHNLGVASCQTGQLAEGIKLLEHARDRKISTLTVSHPDTLGTMHSLAEAYLLNNRQKEGNALLKETHLQRLKILGASHPDTLVTTLSLATALIDAKECEPASVLLKELVTIRRKQPNEPTLLAETLVALARSQTCMGAHKQAEELLKEALAVLEKAVPEVWQTFDTRVQLGIALLNQQRLKEAEPLLKSGYSGLKQREEKVPVRVRLRCRIDALHALIALADQLQRPDEAISWRNELSNVER